MANQKDKSKEDMNYDELMELFWQELYDFKKQIVDKIQEIKTIIKGTSR